MALLIICKGKQLCLCVKIKLFKLFLKPFSVLLISQPLSMNVFIKPVLLLARGEKLNKFKSRLI